ncbi:uncharacterized protein LOC123304880, partial [Chrysoperla carnea]|uniref:uncharacterized protein LOC123304880 n=1 Tax=Chrysoperla carnea TaxID=189513 RepID=UPI001D09693C
MTVVATNEETLMNHGNTAVQRVVQWMEKRKLTIAPEKTEAVLLTTKRNVGLIEFEVQGVSIRPGKVLKQLGVWLDTKLNFGVHLDKTIQKAERTMSALSSLMPNLGGPRASKRRILSSVIHSQLLYAAPAWQQAMKKQHLLRKMVRLQKIICIRVCSGYRTISAEGAGVISGIPPIDLLVDERFQLYEGRPTEEVKVSTMEKWQK